METLTHSNQDWYMGIMSGTSLDGVDLAAVCFQQDKISNIITYYVEYPDELRELLSYLALTPSFDPIQFGELNIKLGRFYADCALRFSKTKAYTNALEGHSLKAIGNHGQTIRHHPSSFYPFTWQMGDPNYLCLALKTPVCYDFRSMDIAAGGQGAPLAPLFHQGIFLQNIQEKHLNSNDDCINTVILNLGGIANITLLSSQKNGDITMHACDTGPANTLLNQWIKRHKNLAYDLDGSWGQSGQLQPALLQDMLKHPYFIQTGPKSTGPEIFNLKWLDSLLKSHPCSAEDVQATLYHFTIDSVALHIQQAIHTTSSTNCNVIVAGGGTRNKYLMHLLKAKLEPWAQVCTSEAYNIDPEFVEAVAFAWLAKQRMEGIALKTAYYTGSKHDIILGSIILPPERF